MEGREPVGARRHHEISQRDAEDAAHAVAEVFIDGRRLPGRRREGGKLGDGEERQDGRPAGQPDPLPIHRQECHQEGHRKEEGRQDSEALDDGRLRKALDRDEAHGREAHGSRHARQETGYSHQ